jgi:hypothetical protein
MLFHSIDCLIPIYIGSVAADTVFDPSRLSVVASQVKVAGDKKAETTIRPIVIPRDLRCPLPHLAILMELGNEERKPLKIKPTASEPVGDGEFEELPDKLITAVKDPESHKRQPKKLEADTERLKRKVKEARLAVDSCNRYSISVPGASGDVYGILSRANIVSEFAALLSITMPPSNLDRTMQHMRPLERLGGASNHTAWMTEYV